MTKTGLVRRGVFMLVCYCALAWFLPQAAGSQQSGNIETLKKVRQSYYSLKSGGMAHFQYNISPNWAALLAEKKEKQWTSLITERMKKHGASIQQSSDRHLLGTGRIVLRIRYSIDDTG